MQKLKAECQAFRPPIQSIIIETRLTSSLVSADRAQRDRALCDRITIERLLIGHNQWT